MIDIIDRSHTSAILAGPLDLYHLMPPPPTGAGGPMLYPTVVSLYKRSSGFLLVTIKRRDQQILSAPLTRSVDVEEAPRALAGSRFVTKKVTIHTAKLAGLIFHPNCPVVT